MDVKIAAEALRITIYKLNCESVMVKWHLLLDYNDLNEWFESNRCCLPIALGRLLDRDILKTMTI